MLVSYSLALQFFDNTRYYTERAESLGFTGAVVALVICEFACSIASIVLSCKAYSKCCNTCDADDSCTCLGCCEWDTTSLNYYQVTQRFIPIALTVMVIIFMIFSVERVIVGFFISKTRHVYLPPETIS